MSYLKSTLASFSAHMKVALMKRQNIGANNNYLPQEDAGLSKDSMIVILTIVCLLLELIVITFVVWLVWYTCFRQWYQRRRLHRNPERQRAEQILHSHPQPVDLELGIIHARSPPSWPLTDSMEMQTTAPSNYNTEGKHIRSSTSAYYIVHSNRALSTCSEASSLSVDAEGQDITDTAISETYIADTETMQEFESDTSDSDYGFHTPHSSSEGFCTEPVSDNQTHSSTAYEDTVKNATEVSDLQGPFLATDACERDTTSNHSESSSLKSYTIEDTSQAIATDDIEATDVDAKNNVIRKDWAYNAH
ncbi:hypothetical protein F5Y12DRAFT_790221 [Xylaria sp. FL1777]|nr:hypothetical protein F5Y12DRAFT_790221 [Xylaria sp. FL1777]